MTTLSGRIDVLAQIERLVPMDVAETIREKYEAAKKIAFSDGDGDLEIDEVWIDSRSYVAATPVAHDLQSLAQLDRDDVTIRSSINFDVVKLLVVVNLTAHATGGHVVLGESSAVNPWDGITTPFYVATGRIPVYPGDVFLWSNSYDGGDVTATENELDVEAITQDQDVLILVAGVKA